MTKAKQTNSKLVKIIAICIAALLFVGSVIAIILLVGGKEPAKDASLERVEISVYNELLLVMSDGTTVNAGKLPENAEDIRMVGATVITTGETDKTRIRISCRADDGSDYDIVRTLPVFGNGISLKNAMISRAGLILYTSEGEKNVGKILYPSIPEEPLAPEGASEYAQSRNTEGRKIAEVKITVKGYGDVTVLLDATTAPRTVEAFLQLAKNGSYNGKTFNMIADSFIRSDSDAASAIYGEYEENGYYDGDISHKRGTISLWHDGNVGSTGGFIICTSDASAELDGKYAAFGYVTNGINIIDEIASLTATFSDYAGMPESETARVRARQAMIESITVTVDLVP